MKGSQANREANIWVARAVPVFLLGITGYGSWVITKVLCIDYLLQTTPSSFTTPQIGPAVAILVIYYVLLCIMLICYGRLIYVVTRYPGLVPRGPLWYKQSSKQKANQGRKGRSRSRRRQHSGVNETKSAAPDLVEDRHTSEKVTRNIAVDADVQVENFWHRDVFTCNHDGRPAFCSHCYNWKPDRAHHCSELDRCVLKMDHFCPWVGGVVGETSFKFFIQFTFWGALFCTHVLVSIAYYFAQRKTAEGVINVHWAVILGISGLFLIFSAGMCMSSLQFAFINSTTIENLSRKRKVWYLAVHVPDNILEEMEHRGRSNLRFIKYPRPLTEQSEATEGSGEQVWQAAPNTTSQPNGDAQAAQASRTFAILETTPGVNPFDLGLKENFIDMMGTGVLEWLLPIHFSPCVRHDGIKSFYKLGPAIDHLKHEARIFDTTADVRPRRRRSKRGRTKSGSHGRQRSGEE